MRGARPAGGGPRAELAVAALLAVVGGGVAFWAAGRGWTVRTTPRPAPFPPDTVVRTGRDLVPWAGAVTVVGVAGGLALLATRGVGRLVVGGVLALAGAVVVAGALVGPGAGSIRPLGPTLTALGGAAVAAAGLGALLRGRRWARMGGRYDAPATRPTRAPGDPAGLWEALDRGDDPTAR